MTRYAKLMDIARRTRRRLDKTTHGGKRLYLQGRMDALSEVATEIFDAPPDVFTSSVEDKLTEPNSPEEISNEKQ